MTSDFDLLSEQFASHLLGNRTESTAMLAWFLENVWREEPDEVEDALCDGSNDKGIDAIVIDLDTREITIFQGKRRRNEDRTQGEVDLQRFRGVAPYFRGPEGIDDLLAAAPNEELRQLVQRLDLKGLLAEEDPWDIKLVYVTNAELDNSATSYLNTTRDEVPPLDVWDRDPLAAVARRTERPGLLPGEHVLAPRSSILVEPLEGDVEMAIALVPANELVRLPGIDDLTLFALNVRLGLGRTKINRELAGTIRDEQADHSLFPAYHNGITILTGELEATDDELTLDGVTVVNGCQSLLALYHNQNSLTPDLSVLVKAVQLSASATLADTITYRSNNQNPVNIRDQRANDPIQRDLQEQVNELYAGRLFYAIRRGEQNPPGTEVLENQDGAQLIMAIWLNEPWAAVRKLKLFDEEYRRIFGRTVDAHRLYLAHRLNQLIDARREGLRPTLAASFASVRFTIAYLTTAVARESELGVELFETPGRWLPDKESEVMQQLAALMDHVVTELNNYVDDRERERQEDPEASAFDPKIAFKSQSSIRSMEHQIMALTRALARRISDFLFDVEPVR
jgi:AIPR protein